MIVYFGNKKIGRLYSGNTELLNPTTQAQENNKLDIEYIIVGGGGAGGAGGSGGSARFQGTGGGGGAGGVITGSISLFAGTFQVKVGDGGNLNPLEASNRNGQTSSFLGYVALGGGGGGNAGDRDTPTCNYGSGSDGGSGGGGGSWVSYWGCSKTAGSGSAGQGNNGAVSGGGGAGSAASGNSGGSGIVWLDGLTYAEGGNSAGASKFTEGSGGNGGNYFPNAGYNGQTGLGGVVKIRYAATSSIATGGTITSSSGYVYHFFPVGTNNFTIPSKV